jgi:hypothetical protein
MFYDACLADRTREWKAWVMYHAVNEFGPKWKVMTFDGHGNGVWI